VTPPDGRIRIRCRGSEESFRWDRLRQEGPRRDRLLSPCRPPPAEQVSLRPLPSVTDVAPERPMSSDSMPASWIAFAASSVEAWSIYVSASSPGLADSLKKAETSLRRLRLLVGQPAPLFAHCPPHLSRCPPRELAQQSEQMYRHLDRPQPVGGEGQLTLAASPRLASSPSLRLTKSPPPTRRASTARWRRPSQTPSLVSWRRRCSLSSSTRSISSLVASRSASLPCPTSMVPQQSHRKP
jgi:hypothetical protein